MAKELASLLSDLIQIDYDAVAAYEAAIDRLDDAAAKASLTEFRGDHERHTRDLSMLIRDMGETPPTEGDFKAVLTQGKVALGGLMGDKQVLQAMKSNEDQTNKAYEDAVAHPELGAETRRLLESNLADERRHRAWIEEHLNSMP